MALRVVNHRHRDTHKHSDALVNMQRTKTLCDVILVAEELEIPAHRAVLAAGSKYFHRMFDSEFIEHKKERIEIRDIESKALQIIVDFLYTYTIQISIQDVRGVFCAAHMFLMDDLEETCIDYIATNLHPTNVLGVLEFARFQVCDKLIERASKFVRVYFREVVQTDEFLSLEHETVSALLSNDDLTIENEEQVLNALLRWINFCPLVRREYLGKLIRHVRLMVIPRGKLLGYMCKEDIIREDAECNQLFKSTAEMAFNPSNDANKVDVFKRIPEDLPNTRLYVISGRKLTETIRVFNFEKNEWNSLDPMMDFRGRRTRARLVVHDHKLYVLGGIRGESLKSTRIFNIRTGEWRPGKPMRNRRTNFAAVGYQGGIFASGGIDNESLLDTAEFLENGPKEAWITLPRMKGYRAYHGATVVENKFYVVGGYANGRCLKTVEFLDEKRETWYSTCEMNVGRSGPGVGTINGCIYVVGGWARSEYLSSCEVFDPVKKGWKFISPMSTARRNPGTFVYKNRLFVIGGEDAKGPHSTIELYDPQFDRWCILPYTLELEGDAMYISAAIRSTEELYDMAIQNTM